MQHTLNTTIEISGIGLHSGKPVLMRLIPAPINHGVVFKRTDMKEGENLIPALFNNVVDTRLCTLIANKFGARVGTIEHVMAALYGCGVDNALIEIDSAEVPIMDGSAKPFVEFIHSVGTKEQTAPRRAIKIVDDIVVNDGDKMVRLSPSNVPVFSGRIEFDHKDIGVQDYMLRLVNGNFRHDVADCRTFGFAKEVQMMRDAGLGLGGSFENAIILDDDGVMNPDGLRCTDEFIRHKILDAVGDLYLVGCPILGHYYGYKAGHAMNNAILHALFANPTKWVMVDVLADIDENEVVVSRPSNAPSGTVLH